MLNLRMLAVASALFLFVPVGVLANGPQQDVIEVTGDVVAEVSDIILVEPKPKPHAASYPLASEQLVEGQSVFVTMDAVTEVEDLEGNVTIEGFARCENSAKVSYSWWYGIPVPTKVEDVRAECHVGERVVFTPTIYCTLAGQPQCGTSGGPLDGAPPMTPTGHLVNVDTPAGDRAYAEELSFTMREPDGAGGWHERTYYAWAVPVLKPWIGGDGKPKNVWLPIPEARLAQMGEQHYSATWEKNVPIEA